MVSELSRERRHIKRLEELKRYQAYYETGTPLPPSLWIRSGVVRFGAWLLGTVTFTALVNVVLLSMIYTSVGAHFHPSAIIQVIFWLIEFLILVAGGAISRMIMVGSTVNDNYHES